MTLRAEGTTALFGELVHRHVERVRDELLAGHDWWVGVDHLDADTLRLRRMADNADGNRPPTFRYAFHAGDVLLPTRRPALRKAALTSLSGLTGEKVLVLRTRDPEQLHPKFLPHLVFSKTIRDWIIQRAVGSVTPHFRWSDLAARRVWIPPVAMQLRLARVLDRFHEALEASRDLAAATRALQARAFEGLVGAAPKRRIADLCAEPPRNGKSPKCNADGRGYPTLSVGCLYSGVVNTRDNLKFAELDSPTYEQYRLQPGDVLVVRGNGNRELCGRAGVVLDNATGCFFPDLLIRVRFNPDLVLPTYAAIAWNALPVHRVLLGRAKSTNGIFKINGKDTREHSIPVPTIQQQQEVVRQHQTLRDAGDAADRRSQDALAFVTAFMLEHFDKHQEPARP